MVAKGWMSGLPSPGKPVEGDAMRPPEVDEMEDEVEEPGVVDAEADDEKECPEDKPDDAVEEEEDDDCSSRNSGWGVDESQELRF